MCLLIATTGKARPSKKALRRAAQQNPDGYGFAVIGDGRIYTYRSMNAEDTIKRYFEVRDEFPVGDSIFHLRITTHGATNIDNCHPFRVNDDVVMGHNGMLPIKEEGGRSDTRIFAEDWLPEFDLVDLLDTDGGIQELEKFAGSSKLAFLNTSSVLRRSLYIVNEDLGHWNEGVWYSNNSYKKNYGSSFGTWSYKATPTYTIRDRRHSYTPNDDYTDYTWNGMVWDDEEATWVQVQHDVLDDDIVQWTCETCGNQEIFDLNQDDPEICMECSTCWYCNKIAFECQCYSQLTLDLDGEF